MRLDFAIGLRYFRSRRQEGAVSFISAVAIGGVTLGVAALVVAMSVMNGYQVNLVRAMAGALPHLALHALSRGEVPPAALVRERLADAGFGGATTAPFILREALLQGQGMTHGGPNVQGVILRGVDPEGESRVPGFLAFLDTGAPDWKTLPLAERQRRARALLDKLEAPLAPGVVPVLISHTLADKLGVAVGKHLVPLAFPGPDEAGFSPRPLPARLRVVGYFNTGIVAFDELVTITGVSLVADVFPHSDPEPSLGVRLPQPLRAGDAARALRYTMDGVGTSFYVYSWLESNQGLFQVIRLQKVTLFLVLMLIVVIAFFGMVSALVMLVGEKTREITILKALGLRERAVYRLFVLQGLLIGVAGTVLGVALGLGVCGVLEAFPVFEIPPGVYPGSDRVPVSVAPLDVALVAGATLVVCLAATLFPARKGMALKVAEGLRNG